METILRRAGFWLVAFALSYALWLVHDDSAQLPELLAGAGVAALAATGAELARGHRVARIAIRLRFLRSAWRLVPYAARDCAALTRAAFAQLIDPRPARGQTVAVPFRYRGDDPDANGQRALALGLGSFAPGTIVIGVDPDREVLIAHQLAGSGAPSELDPLDLR